jgi:hypothetical protein
VHAPLQVPQFYVDKFAWIDDSSRKYYMAMVGVPSTRTHGHGRRPLTTLFTTILQVNFLDDLVGRVVAKLKAKGMWDNLLWAT